MAQPKRVGDITLPWLREAISNEYSAVRIKSMSVDASVGDMGFIGSICRINLTYEAEQNELADTFILKLPGESEEALAAGKQLGAYSNEANFYRHLANLGVGNAPRHYFSLAEPDTGEYIIAIEDLSPLRFVSQTEGANVKDCHTVMKAMASLHGSFWGDTAVGKGWLGTSADWGDAFEPLIETGFDLCLRNFSQHLDNKFLEKFESGASAHRQICQHLAAGRTTLIHGDAHIRNLAFDDEADNPVRFFDWSMCCRGPAAWDLLFFVINSLPVADQDQYLDALLDTYCHALADYVPDYKREDLDRDIAYCTLRLFGYIAFIGAILPVNEATTELVRESTPRYHNMIEKFGGFDLLSEFTR